MAFEKNGGGSGVKKIGGVASTVSNPVNTGGKISGVASSIAPKAKDVTPKQTGITPVSEVSNPVNTGNFSQSKEKAKESGSSTTNIASDSNFSVLEPYVNNNNDWERQEQERLLAEERRMAEEQRRAQEEMRRQAEQDRLAAEEAARIAAENARIAQENRVVEQSNEAIENVQQTAEEQKAEQPSSSYMPYGDPRLNQNPLSPKVQGAVSRLSRGNSAYVGNEQLDDYAAWQARQNQNKGTGLVPLATYTPTDQSKNAFKVGSKLSAQDEDETEFYTGMPQTDVDVTNPATYSMNAPGVTLGPGITMPNPIEYGIQTAIEQANAGTGVPWKDNLGWTEDRALTGNDVLSQYGTPAGFTDGIIPAYNPQPAARKITGALVNAAKDITRPAANATRNALYDTVADVYNASNSDGWLTQQVSNLYDNLPAIDPDSPMADVLEQQRRDRLAALVAQIQADDELIDDRPKITGSDVSTAIEQSQQNTRDFTDRVIRASRYITEPMKEDLVDWATSGGNYGNAVTAAADAAIEAGFTPGTLAYDRFVDNYVGSYTPPTTTSKEDLVDWATSGGNNGKADNPVNTRPANYNMGTQTSTGDLALEASIRRGDTTYEKVYDDYVAQHKDKMGEQDARRAAYQKIYDLGYRPDVNDEASYMHYVKGMDQSLIEDLEKAMKNNYYTNDASYLDRVINMTAGGFDRSDEQNQQFYDLTSELAGNAFANSTKGTNYNTTPGYTTDEKGNPLMNSALEASMSGQLTPDQILHFYDAGYSDLVVPEEAQKWFASDSTHALQELFLNNGDNLNRLEKELGSEDELNEAVRSLINANPSLKALYENGNLTPADIAYNFMKAPVDNKGDLVGSYANGGSGNKNTYFTPSYGQGGTGVKAPYKNGGYTAAELQAMGNMPYTDRYGNTQYEGYYLAPDGNWYPVDQEKAAYYQKYGTYNGWDEGMRKYYNTFGTFYGYTPTWKSTGRKKSSYSGGSYSKGGSNYSYSSSKGGSSGNNYGYSYYTPTTYNRTSGSSVTPSSISQRQNRIYNIMKNWSF